MREQGDSLTSVADDVPAQSAPSFTSEGMQSDDLSILGDQLQPRLL